MGVLCSLRQCIAHLVDLDHRPLAVGPPPATHGRNKWLEYTHPWMPRAIPSWRHAMDVVEHHPAIRRTGPVWGYWVPEPALLVSPQTRARQLCYLTNWIRARPAWLFLLQVTGSRATAVGSQFWRSYLIGVPEDFRTETKVGRRRLAIQHIFGDCFDDHRLQVDASAPVSWHGNHFTEVPEHLAPWVVWECFELGFRYDLLALDKYMRRTSGVDGEVRREDLLSRVFPRSSFLAVDRLPHIDSSGLFACLPHRRVHSLNALRDVMILWPGCPASIMDSPYLSLTSTSSAIEALEFQLASFYVNLFYSVSGRPPVLPHLGPYESSSISGSALAA